jgi:flagellar biosynthesis anti-sigma factor FlgM
MRIESTGLSGVSKSATTPEKIDQRDEAAAPGHAKVDDVSLSPQARLVAMAKRALSEVPGVRASVIERARERLQAGQYDADGRRIAEAILEALRESD